MPNDIKVRVSPTYSKVVTINRGPQGVQGIQGTSVASATVTVDNELIFTLSDSTTISASYINQQYAGINREWTATEGQDTFTDSLLTTLSVIMVYQNGMKLSYTDFTQYDGYIVLNTPASLDDIIYINNIIYLADADFLPLAGGTLTGDIYGTQMFMDTISASSGTIDTLTSSTITATLINVTEMIFNTTATYPNGAVGSFMWNTADGTLNLVMAGGQVIQQIGEELYWYVKNTSGTTISNGKIVSASGAVGASDHITITLSNVSTADGSTYILGVATEDIADNAFGFVTAFGVVRGINTSAWSIGTILYPDPYTPGGFTATLYEVGSAKAPIAFVLNSNPANGSIAVRPDRNTGLHEMHDVTLTLSQADDLLSYQGGRWVNKPISDYNYMIKEATISQQSASFSTTIFADVTGSGIVVECTTTLSITLETYSDKSEGFQFGVIAGGGPVTFLGTFSSKEGMTTVETEGVAYVVRKSAGWQVAGATA